MKKILVFLLISILALGTAACGGEAEQKPMPADMASMAAPIDALARCMLENNMAYSPEDPAFFWTALFYFTGAYGLQHPLAEETEHYEIMLPSQAMQEHASVLFANYNDLFPLTDNMAGNISYDSHQDAYFVSRGDIGLSALKLTSFAETKDGYAITAELCSTGETEERIAAWDVVLVENAYTDGIENPLYLYSVADITMQEGEGSGVENIAPHETITAVFNGLSDSHTAEFTMTDGSIEVFQFDGDSSVGNILSQLKEGEGLTFGYITDTAGTSKIVTTK